MTTEAQQTPFPEENTVYLKEIQKIQSEIFSVESSTDTLYTEAEKLHANRLWHISHVDHTYHSFTCI